VLYTSDGQIKITDFGLAVPSADTQGLLEGRCFPGTADYSAPEQRFGLALDARCDVFSLATLAYELLAGRVPGRIYVPISQHRPRLPAALDDVLRRGLARDADDRYESMSEFRQAFLDACHDKRRPPRGRWLIATAAGLAVLAVVWLAVRSRETVVRPPSAAAETVGELPTKLWVLYDKPQDLSLFTGEKGGELSGAAGMAVHHVAIEEPVRKVPAELTMPFWPTSRPLLVVRSPTAWGFVYPLADPTLGQRVLKNWPALLRMVVTPEQNMVKTAGPEQVGLIGNRRSGPWRADVSGWSTTRHISLKVPPERTGQSALLLTNLDPEHHKDLLGCYQALEYAPPPNAVMVVRYRARSHSGKGQLQVYVRMSLVVPENETGTAASRIRSGGTRLAPQADDPLPNRWLFRVPVWVRPTVEWQTYLVIYESPPFPSRTIDRNLVVDVSGTDQVWVDALAWFVWRPENPL
jgi:hypothetical protein